MPNNNTQPKPLKLMRLKIRNFGPIEGLEITPEGKPVELHGQNGSGKSTVINAIEWAVKYSDAKKHVAQPVRNGADSCQVIAEFEEFIVERSMANGKPKLKITPKPGFKSGKSSQGLLDSFLGKISVDPSEFLHLKAREQITAIMDAFNINFDLDDYERQRKSAYESRRDHNRRAKDLTAQLEGIPDPGDIPEPPSMSELLARRDAETRRAREYEQDSTRLAEIHRRYEQITHEVATLKKERAEIAVEGNELDAKIKAANPPADMNAIDEEIAGIEQRQAEIQTMKRDAERREQLADELDRATSQAKIFDNGITALDRQKTDSLAAAKIPIEGFELREDGIYVGDVPLSDRSDGEQLLIAAKIAMHAHPGYKIVALKRASLFDRKTLTEFYMAAQAEGVQPIVELVSDDSELAVEIVEAE